MSKYQPYWILLALLSSLSALAQISVTGVVKDADTRQPLPYCNVVIAGNTSGTTTDGQGKFAIRVEQGGTALVVSFVGYLSDTVKLVTGKSNYAILLKEASKSLDEVVVVSGTMKEVTRMNSPIAVEIYSPALFMKNPTPSIFEALSMINGVQPQLNCNVCNTGDIHINGMEGPYTMLLIDGMPIVSSLATVYGLSGIPNSMVKRIEVVKGPASTLYGSEAVGGLINIITKDPATSAPLKTDFSATSLGEVNTDIAATFRTKRADALLGVNYFYYQNDIDINDDNFTDVTQQKRFSIFNKWDIKRASLKPASIALRYVYEDRWGGELQWTKEHRGSGTIYGESIYTNRFEFISSYELPVKKEKIQADVSYNFHKQDSYYGVVSYQADQHVFFTQLRWNRRFGKHDILSGIPFRMIRYDDNTPGTASVVGNAPATTYLPGIFIQDEYAVNKSLTLLGGLRYDQHNEHGGIFSPRVSVKINPAKDHTIRLSAGNGFRVVNLFTEDHAALTGSRQVIIGETLKPEQSWNVNLNYAMLLSGNKGFTNLDVTLFYTYFTNKIVGDFLTDPNKIFYNNLDGHAVSRGVTFNSDITLLSNLKFIGGVTLMDVYQVEPNNLGEMEQLPQLFAPRFSATYTLSYSFVKPAITVDFTGRTNGPMHLPVLGDFDPRPAKSPTYSILNIQLSKVFRNGIEIYGGVKNLLNFIPEDPLFNPQEPFSDTFDASYNYAPVQGIKGFAGIRYTL